MDPTHDHGVEMGQNYYTQDHYHHQQQQQYQQQQSQQYHQQHQHKYSEPQPPPYQHQYSEPQPPPYQHQQQLNLHPGAVTLIPKSNLTDPVRSKVVGMLYPRGDIIVSVPNHGGDLNNLPDAQEVINVCKTTPWPPQQFVGNKADQLYQQMSRLVGSDNILPPSGIQSESNQIKFLKTHVNALSYFYYKSPKYRKKIQDMLDTNVCAFKYCPFFYSTPCYIMNWLCCPFTLVFPCCFWCICGTFGCGTTRCSYDTRCFQPNIAPGHSGVLFTTGIGTRIVEMSDSSVCIHTPKEERIRLDDFREAFIQHATAAGFNYDGDNFTGWCIQHFCAPIYLNKYFTILSYYNYKRWGQLYYYLPRSAFEPIDEDDETMRNYLDAVDQFTHKPFLTRKQQRRANTNARHAAAATAAAAADMEAAGSTPGPVSDNPASTSPQPQPTDGFKSHSSLFAQFSRESMRTNPTVTGTVRSPSNTNNEGVDEVHEPREIGWFGEWQMGRLQQTIDIHNHYWGKLHSMNANSLNTGLIME